MIRKRALLFFLFLLLTALGGCGGEDAPRLTPLPENALILAFGDSLTYGTGARTEESYPAVLGELTGLQVINAGIPGEESEQGRARLTGLLDQHQPDLLILCHGGNDILRKLSEQRLVDNLLAMIEEARRRGVQVVLLGVPKFALFGLKSAEFYLQVAQAQQVPIEAEIIPAIEGYRMMAEAVHRLLRERGALAAE